MFCFIYIFDLMKKKFKKMYEYIMKINTLLEIHFPNSVATVKFYGNLAIYYEKYQFT